MGRSRVLGTLVLLVFVVVVSSLLRELTGRVEAVVAFFFGWGAMDLKMCCNFSFLR